jgi:hypothetical protein
LGGTRAFAAAVANVWTADSWSSVKRARMTLFPTKVTDPGDGGLARGRGQEAVMPDAVEVVGRDVEQEPADELVGGEPLA